MTTEQEERKQVYANTRQDLLTRNLSNSERYDNAILTLSTGVLGISLAFIKDIVPLNTSSFIFLLIISWVLFGAAIISTLLSFLLSQRAIKRQLEYAEKYYLENEDDYLNKRNIPALWTDFINYVSGVLFMAGIIVTICFVSINIEGDTTMAKDTSKFITDGATIPTLQKIQPGVVEKGANIPSMQPVKPSTPDSPKPISPASPISGQTGKK